MSFLAHEPLQNSSWIINRERVNRPVFHEGLSRDIHLESHSSLPVWANYVLWKQNTEQQGIRLICFYVRKKLIGYSQYKKH